MLFIIPCVCIQESLHIQIHDSLIFWVWTGLWSFQYLLSLIIMMIFVLLSTGRSYLQEEDRAGEWNLASLRSCARILMKGKWRQSLLGGLLGWQYSLSSTLPPSYFPLRKWFLLSLNSYSAYGCITCNSFEITQGLGKIPSNVNHLKLPLLFKCVSLIVNIW